MSTYRVEVIDDGFTPDQLAKMVRDPKVQRISFGIDLEAETAQEACDKVHAIYGPGVWVDDVSPEFLGLTARNRAILEDAK